MEFVNPAGERRQKRARPAIAPGTRVALGIFALMAVAGPLLFGAVDRFAQITLVVLLTAGVLAQPPAVAPLGRWGNRLVIAFLGLVLCKEFAPAAWFAPSLWRTVMTREFGLALPWTHHPEPARVLDALLAGLVALVWFLWVRRLAADRENRPVLAWSLFAAAAIVSAVAFATRGIDPKAIYGLRFTPAWSGFGPFPNRNHTGDFLAMGAVIGCGCVTWAAARKRWTLLAAGVLLLGLILFALLATESRGGLIAFGGGLVAYLGLTLMKVHTRKALSAAVAAALCVGALGLAFGADVFSRFQSEKSGLVSTVTRLRVWEDALAMWQDAPLLGHGLGSFAGVFPLYQSVELENQVVLHPESSWLQWLTELGALPVLIAVGGFLIFLQHHRPNLFASGRSFFLRAACLSAVAVLLGHAALDVPAHRWGTAGYALAALAVACPMHLRGRRPVETRQVALVPLAIAIFWCLPFVVEAPAWSPVTLARLLARQSFGGEIRLAELENSLRYFPLNAALQQAAGLRKVRVFGRAAPAAWQRHFAIAARLVPGSWSIPAAQARAVQTIAPGLALGYWQQAIERGGAHREDVFRTAVLETAGWPLSEAAWGRYVEAHPRLLLAYTQLVPEAQARYYFALWWKERALTAPLTENEIEAFYQLAPRWGSRGQFDAWMDRRDAWRARDFRTWATLLHGWGDQDRAWKLLADALPEPPFPAAAANASREPLETKWRLSPENLVNAQQLALARFRAGDTAQSDELILTVAADPQAPPWFRQKGAHILARSGRSGEAVSMLLSRR